MRRALFCSVFVGVALLATGPAASAHGTVVQVGDLYLITSDGETLIMRENNGKTDEGIVNYAAAEPTPVGAQFHATCDGLFTLEDSRAWQDESRWFFAYVPWQIGGGGLGYEPESWLSWLNDEQGFDLVALSETGGLDAACAELGGTFVPADEILVGPLP